jgi:hypothetical protein
MASFKELTLPDGEKIVVNMEEIRTMQRYNNSPETRIAFAHDHGVDVKETPSDVMMKLPLLHQ